MRNPPFIALAFVVVMATVTSCDPQEERISGDSNLSLTYSTDTVFFDTLLSSVGSITKRLKIFNPNKRAIALDRIAVGRGQQSEFTLVVNGVEGKSFTEEVIFGRDSMLVLVDALIDPANENLPFLVRDSVVIEYNSNRNHVNLVSWGQDANFIRGAVIDCDETWTADKPYVIYEAALLDSLCTLTVEAGTRILIDNGASLLINGSLQINGTADEKVIIRNTRLDPAFRIAPGQWDGIYFLEGSFDNHIHHAEIRNGQIGLRVGNPDDDPDFDLVVTNTSIGHMSVAGVRGFTSDIEMINCEIFNCQGQTFGGFIGGNYRIEHCTFSNSPNLFSREEPSVQFSDFLVLNDESTLVSDLTVDVRNSIIWGDLDEELAVIVTEQVPIDVTIEHNIIRSADEAWAVANNVISRDDNYPGFNAPIIYDYQLDSLANARGAAVGSEVEFDLLGNVRDEFPDLGAYERKDSIP